MIFTERFINFLRKPEALPTWTERIKEYKIKGSRTPQNCTGRELTELQTELMKLKTHAWGKKKEKKKGWFRGQLEELRGRSQGPQRTIHKLHSLDFQHLSR